MKKIILFLVFGISTLLAQSPGPKWVTILDLEDQKVFVDTSTIKQFQNQISVLSITFFKTPQKIESLNGLASSVKSQILFNLGLQKYSTIGTLYYDDKLKILGESSLPGFAAGGAEAFSVSIDSNQVVANIYAYCLKFINRGEREVSEKEFSIESERTRKTLERLAPRETIKIESAVQQPNKESEKSAKTELVSKDSSKIKTVAGMVRDSTVKVVENLSNKKENALKELKTKKQTAIEPSSSESNLQNGIFNEGGKYSFQVSSWKSKAKAESEAAKLKAQGHSAFIVEAFVSEKRGTWYRVRVGYFSSLEETLAYQKKLK